MREGWTEACLRDVAILIMGQSPPGASFNADGVGVPFIQGAAEFGPRIPTIAKWSTSPTRMAEAGDILMSVRAPVGALNRTDGALAIGRGVAAIRGRGGTTTEFLALALVACQAELRRRSTSGMFESITKAEFESVQVPVPPLDERRRIVDIISTLDDEVAALKSTARTARTMRVGLLSELLSGNHEIPSTYDRLLEAA